MGLGTMGLGAAGGDNTAGVVSTFCLVTEALSKDSRSLMEAGREDGREDGREELERPKDSMVELLRTALFKRPVHLGFGLPLLMINQEVERFARRDEVMYPADVDEVEEKEGEMLGTG